MTSLVLQTYFISNNFVTNARLKVNVIKITVLRNA